MFKRDVIILGMVILLAMALGAWIITAQAVETASWGLSFRTEGAPPVGPANANTLAGFDAAYLGDTTQKTLYLTFDAGFENGCTGQILDILKKHSVPAAFFLVGNYLEQNADLVRRMVEEGHIVGNHTMHHPDMSKIENMESFRKELEDLEEKYSEITGKEMPKFYRPPQGTYSQKNLEMAKELGYKTVFWSLAYVDWKQDDQPAADYAFRKLLPRTLIGAVVLLHSTSSTNAQILDQLLTKWKAMGYSFGTVDALFS